MTILNVELPQEQAIHFSAALIANNMLFSAHSQTNGTRRGYVHLSIKVLNYSHQRLEKVLYSTDASIIAVLLENGQRFTMGKATLLRECTKAQCAIVDLWGVKC